MQSTALALGLHDTVSRSRSQSTMAQIVNLSESKMRSIRQRDASFIREMSAQLVQLTNGSVDRVQAHKKLTQLCNAHFEAVLASGSHPFGVMARECLGTFTDSIAPFVLLPSLRPHVRRMREFMQSLQELVMETYAAKHNGSDPLTQKGNSSHYLKAALLRALEKRVLTSCHATFSGWYNKLFRTSDQALTAKTLQLSMLQWQPDEVKTAPMQYKLADQHLRRLSDCSTPLGKLECIVQACDALCRRQGEEDSTRRCSNSTSSSSSSKPRSRSTSRKGSNKGSSSRVKRGGAGGRPLTYSNKRMSPLLEGKKKPNQRIKVTVSGAAGDGQQSASSEGEEPKPLDLGASREDEDEEAGQNDDDDDGDGESKSANILGGDADEEAAVSKGVASLSIAPSSEADASHSEDTSRSVSRLDPPGSSQSSGDEDDTTDSDGTETDSEDECTTRISSLGTINLGRHESSRHRGRSGLSSTVADAEPAKRRVLQLKFGSKLNMRLAYALVQSQVEHLIPQAHYITDFMDDDSALSGLRGRCMRALVAAIEILHLLEVPHNLCMDNSLGFGGAGGMGGGAGLHMQGSSERADLKNGEPMVPIQHLTLADLRARQSFFPVKDCHKLEKMVHSALHDLAQLAGPGDSWKYLQTKGHVQIYAREDPDESRSVSFVKGVALIPATPMQITNLIKDVPKRHIYDPFVNEGKTLELIDDNTLVTHMSFKTGKLFASTKRDVVLLEHRQLADEGQINLVATSIDDLYETRATRVTRGHVRLSGFQMTPLREGNWKRNLDLVPASSLGLMGDDASSSSDDDFADFAVATGVQAGDLMRPPPARQQSLGMAGQNDGRGSNRTSKRSSARTTPQHSRGNSRRGSNASRDGRGLSVGSIGDSSSHHRKMSSSDTGGSSSRRGTATTPSKWSLLKRTPGKTRQDAEEDWSKLRARFETMDVPLTQVTYVLHVDFKGNMSFKAKNQINRQQPLVLNTIAKLLMQERRRAAHRRGLPSQEAVHLS